MIEFRTLGALDLRNARDGQQLRALLAQPKRVGLLAFLAAGRVEFARRDTLVGVFWPEATEARARGALNQTIYLLRQTLGENAITTHGDNQVGVNRTVIRCDAATLQDALAAGELGTAVDLYGGDFLPGFHLDGLLEFERWLESQRAELRRAAVQASGTLAERDRDAGNLTGAVLWRRRALGIDPYDESSARELLAALDASGDRVDAIREYEAFVTRLARDLDLEASPDTVSLIETIRNRRDVRTRGKRATADDEPVAGAQEPPDPARQTNEPGGMRSRHARRRLVIAIASTAIAAVAVASPLRARLERSRHADLQPSRILVAPFESAEGDSTLTLLGRLAADWVMQGVQRAGVGEVIDPATAAHLPAAPPPSAATAAHAAWLEGLAMWARAATIVAGTLEPHGDSVVFRARIVDARDGRVMQGLNPVAANRQAPNSGLEELRSRVTGALALLLDARVAGSVSPSSSPPTFEAYSYYAMGMERMAQFGPVRGKPYFERAAELDSTFVMASFWAAVSWAFNSTWHPKRDSLAARLNHLRTQLPVAEQAGLDMLLALGAGDHRVALLAAQRAARLAPASSWSYIAADLALRQGEYRAALSELAVFDPGSGWPGTSNDYWRVRIQAHHRLGEYDKALAAARLGQRILSPQAQLGSAVENGELWALSALGRLGELEDRVAVLEPRYLAHAGRGRTALMHLRLGQELREHGHPGAARQHWTRCLEILPSNVDCMYQLGDFAGIAAIEQTIPGGNIIHSLMAARQGRRQDAERIDTVGWGTPAVLTFQARLALLSGDTARALQLLRANPDRGNLWGELHWESDYDAIRNDPYIAALMGRSVNTASASR